MGSKDFQLQRETWKISKEYKMRNLLQTYTDLFDFIHVIES